MASIDVTRTPAAVDDDLQIIDCDSHFTEPPDLWSSRVPASLKDRVPFQRTVGERTGWFLNDEMWASVGGNTIRTGREKVRGTMAIHPFRDIDPVAWSVDERLSLLDDLGIYAQVVYPNGIGFASNHVFAIEDLEQRQLVLQTFNDFYVDLHEDSGGRLLPQGLLPVWDMDLTVQEMHRLVEKGLKGFTLSDKPELLGLPELPDAYFDPMWDTFNDTGAVANFHIGSGATKETVESMRSHMSGEKDMERESGTVPTEAPPAWNYLGKQRQLAVTSTLMYMSNMRIITNLCMSDLFDRYPNLKVVSAESGIGWVPFILEAMEWQLDETVTAPEERAHQKRRPTEYFRDHIYVMFWFERLGARLIEDIGVRNVLVETDIPHPTCLYPGGREHFRSVLADLDDHVRQRVLRDNAAELYGISVGG